MNLNQFYKELLDIPYENILQFYFKKPIDYKNISDYKKEGFGGTCFPLSLYCKDKLDEIGIESKLIFFDLNREYINRTIKVRNKIDKKYHNAIIFDIKKEDKENKKISSFKLMDLGLQIEDIIEIDNMNEFNFNSKKLIYNRLEKDKNKFSLDIYNSGKKEDTLFFDLNFKYSKKDLEKHLENNYRRVIPLKYSILDENGVKHSLKIRKGGFEIKKSRYNKKEIIPLRNLVEVSNYFGISFKILKKSYINWKDLQGKNYFNSLNKPKRRLVELI